MSLETAFIALVAMLGLGLVGWLLSLLKQDVSVVDSFWSLFFLLGAILYIDIDKAGWREGFLLALVQIWALRLSFYITWRHMGKDEDPRYQDIRANNQPHFALKSLYLIFGFQALLAWIISMPLFAAMQNVSSFGWLDLLGVCLWLTGMFFEVIGDQQMYDFKQNPDNRGKVMSRGLWGYTRHPNYFGEFLIWWGFFAFALSSGAWWTLFSPLIMSVLLLKFSGVALTEKNLSERPGYREYIARTNAFFPGPSSEYKP